MWWQPLVVFALGVATPALTRWLIRTSRPRPVRPAPYDWLMDTGLLDVWARDREGELVSVIPMSWVAAAEMMKGD
jgi:hypothetical protein